MGFNHCWRIILLFFFYFETGLSGQTDSIIFYPETEIKDGIYLNYHDFRRNKAIDKEQVISNQDKTQLEFISKIISQKTFSYSTNGIIRTVDPGNVYGFFQNRTFHVNFNGEFYRVPVFGSISYFVANVKVYRSFYNPL